MEELFPKTDLDNSLQLIREFIEKKGTGGGPTAEMKQMEEIELQWARAAEEVLARQPGSFTPREIVGLTERRKLIEKVHRIFEKLQQIIPKLTLSMLCDFLQTSYVLYTKNKNKVISRATLYQNVMEYRRKRVHKY